MQNTGVAVPEQCTAKEGFPPSGVVLQQLHALVSVVLALDPVPDARHPDAPLFHALHILIRVQALMHTKLAP